MLARIARTMLGAVGEKRSIDRGVPKEEQSRFGVFRKASQKREDPNNRRLFDWRYSFSNNAGFPTCYREVARMHTPVEP